MGKKLFGFIGAVWGILGVSAFLGWAVARLTPYMLEVLHQELQWYHWALLVINVVFMAYTEGYKGFQQGAAPRLGARVRHLYQNPTVLHVIFSPFFCSSYFHTTKRRLIARYILTSMIILLIILVSRLHQPWRGIIDAGVLIGLAWGLVAILYQSIKALMADEFHYSPELPESTVAVLTEKTNPQP
ncbi:MAG: hypothetical protein K9K86_02945 [Pseudomonadales bacterium]|nr:hypothetical protein [Pseudomonadales bacterium]